VADHRALERNLSERSLQRRNKRRETFVDLLVHAEDMARDDRIRNRPNQFATKCSNPQRPSLCYKMLRNASKCFVLTRSHLCTRGATRKVLAFPQSNEQQERPFITATCPP
jgi:hypothetical protein